MYTDSSPLALLVTTCVLLLLSIGLGMTGGSGGGVDAQVAPPIIDSYTLPVNYAVLDQYAALLRFAVYKETITTAAPGLLNQDPVGTISEDTSFDLFGPLLVPDNSFGGVSGPSESRTIATLLLASLQLDLAAAGVLNIDAASLSLVPVNSSTLRLQFETSQPAEAHNRLAAGFDQQLTLLLNKTRTVFSKFVGESRLLSGAQLTHFNLYSTSLEVDLVDPEGGRGPAWGAAQIQEPSVLRSLEADLLNVLALRASLDAILPAGATTVTGNNNDGGIPAGTPAALSSIAALGAILHFQNAEEITDARYRGSRRVRLTLKLECDRIERVALYAEFLLGRYELPLSTAELKRQVSTQAGVLALIRKPNSVAPAPEFCGPGCYIPAILWLSILVGMGIVLSVACGGSTPEQEADDVKAAGEEELKQLERDGYLKKKTVQSEPQQQLGVGRPASNSIPPTFRGSLPAAAAGSATPTTGTPRNGLGQNTITTANSGAVSASRTSTPPVASRTAQTANGPGGAATTGVTQSTSSAAAVPTTNQQQLNISNSSAKSGTSLGSRLDTARPPPIQQPSTNVSTAGGASRGASGGGVQPPNSLAKMTAQARQQQNQQAPAPRQQVAGVGAPAKTTTTTTAGGSSSVIVGRSPIQGLLAQAQQNNQQ